MSVIGPVGFLLAAVGLVVLVNSDRPWEALRKLRTRARLPQPQRRPCGHGQWGCNMLACHAGPNTAGEDATFIDLMADLTDLETPGSE